MSFSLKEGISLRGVRPELLHAASVVAWFFHRIDLRLVVTSAQEGRHMKGSLHDVGLALDFRIRDVPVSMREALVRGIRGSLGDSYDVVLERDHLHIEYDPKV